MIKKSEIPSGLNVRKVQNFYGDLIGEIKACGEDYIEKNDVSFWALWTAALDEDALFHDTRIRRMRGFLRRLDKVIALEGKT